MRRRRRVDDPDVILIRRYLKGDLQAFELLMEAHEQRVFAIALRMMRNREAALDVTQETFITVLRKAAGFQGRAAFSTWLYRVTVNTCYDHLRKQRRQQWAPLPEGYDPPDPSTDDLLESTEIRPTIEDGLAELPEKFAVALILVDVEGLPLREVSEILHIPVGTVKSRVFRARRMLAARLGNLLTPDDSPKDERP